MDEIVLIKGDEELERLRRFLEFLVESLEKGYTFEVRAAIDGGSLKLKAGQGVWSPPLGRLADEGERT